MNQDNARFSGISIMPTVVEELPEHIRKGYIDVSKLRITRALQGNYPAIRAEYETLFSAMDPHLKPNGPMSGQYGKYTESTGIPMYQGTNLSAHLYVHPELLDDREKEICYAPGIEEKRLWRQKHCPILKSILEPYNQRGELGNVGFNKILPGTRINPHFGVSSDFFRLHLGIVTDPGATFYIKDAPPYTWTDGGVMAFYDGDVLHWVEHNGTSPRTILAIDLRISVLTSKHG